MSVPRDTFVEYSEVHFLKRHETSCNRAWTDCDQKAVEDLTYFPSMNVSTRYLQTSQLLMLLVTFNSMAWKRERAI